MKLPANGAKQTELRFKVRSERIHQQMATNRRRNLSVQAIDSQMGWLFIETEVVITTTRHRSNGHLKQRNMTRSKCNNHGLVSRYHFLDLVKPIFLKDIPAIVEDFKCGKPIHAIKYSDWAHVSAQSKQASSATMSSVANELFAASHKTATLTTRIIKSVTSLIGF